MAADITNVEKLVSILRRRLQPISTAAEVESKNNTSDLFEKLKTGRYINMFYSGKNNSSLPASYGDARSAIIEAKPGDDHLATIRSTEDDDIQKKEEMYAGMILVTGGEYCYNFICEIDLKAEKSAHFRKEIESGPDFLLYLFLSGRIDNLLYKYFINFYNLQKERIANIDMKMREISAAPWLSFSYK
jgi:hypothetical protein